MRPVVPFVHAMGETDAGAWIDELRRVMPDLDVRFAKDIPADERAMAEVAIVANPDPAALSKFPNLKWVQSLWAGVERIVRDMHHSDVGIARLIDPQLADTMAEAVLAWSLFLHRDMPKYAAQQASRTWSQLPLRHRSDRMIGVLGLGNLGAAAIKRLHENGFATLGWSRSEMGLPGIETLHGHEGLRDVAARADILIILLPSTRETRGLIDGRFIKNMKSGASLINFARADIVDAQALANALKARKIDHAVLDVFATEPLPKDSALWADPHVTVLPHISAPTNKVTASQVVAHNLNTYFASGQLPPLVSRDAGY